MKIEDLINDYLKWTKETIVQKRLDNGEQGYGWVYKDINFQGPISLDQFQTFFDRTDQNSEYKEKYGEEEIQSKKPYSWLQTEINMIYSFHKCFAMRNATRLQYYRNDLSQKGVRNRSAINIGLGKYMHKKEQAEGDS